MTMLIDNAPVQERRTQSGPNKAPEGVSASQENGQAELTGQKGLLSGTARRVLTTHAFLISLLVSVPAVFVAMTIFNAGTLYKNVAASLAAGDLTGFLVVATSFLYALLATLAVGYIRESERVEQRDRAADNRQSSLIDSVSEVQANSLKMSTMLTRLESQKRAVTFTGPNNVARWKPLYPRSTYWKINPLGRFDFIDDPQADGSVNRVPDWQRINDIYVPRFDKRTKLRGYNIVVFVSKQSGKSVVRVPEQIKYVLNLFRAIEFAARASGVSIDLSMVRIYVREAADAQVSFFVGEMDINGRPVPFANQYVSVTKSFNVGRIILDDRVTTTFDPTEVEAFRLTAEQLGYGIPALSIRDAEAKWGHLVTMPNWQPHEVGAVVEAAPATLNDGIIDLGDGSFYIP